jgi:integrase
MKLTKRKIDTLQPKANKSGKISQTFFYDDAVTGFGVKVNPTGSKVYILSYRFKGIRKRTTIGNCNGITLEQGRDRAHELLSDIAKNMDPQEQKTLAKLKGRTFNDLIERYYSTHALSNKTQTQSANKHFIDKILKPKIGNKEINNISKQIVSDIVYTFKDSISQQTHLPMSSARTNRLISLLSKLFNLAVQWDWIDKSPAKGLIKLKEEKRERIATDTETQKVFKSIHLEENIYYRNFFLMLWWTMARRSEIQNMRWDLLDLHNRTYHFETTKAGRPFTMHLTEDAIEIINTTPRIVGNPYIFAGQAHSKPINGIGKAWKRVRERAKVKGLWLHDIRRTGGSNMIMNGASLQDVAQLLNHSNLATTQRYAQLVQNHKKSKMSEHGDRLRAITGGAISNIKKVNT